MRVFFFGMRARPWSRALHRTQLGITFCANANFAMAQIILLEDDDVFRETLIQVLTKAGHTVKAATNGFDGLALFRSAGADVILTDIVMPHGGLPTIRVLRGEFPKLPIVAMSGSHIRLDMAGGLGANKTLSKPFSSQQLLVAINEVLGPTA